MGVQSGAYLRKIAPMVSTKIAFYIYYLLIISPGIHVYVYYMVFAKLLQENYLKNLLALIKLFNSFYFVTLMNRDKFCILFSNRSLSSE